MDILRMSKEEIEQQAISIDGELMLLLDEMNHLNDKKTLLLNKFDNLMSLQKNLKELIK